MSETKPVPATYEAAKAAYEGSQRALAQTMRESANWKALAKELAEVLVAIKSLFGPEGGYYLERASGFLPWDGPSPKDAFTKFDAALAKAKEAGLL